GRHRVVHDGSIPDSGSVIREPPGAVRPQWGRPDNVRHMSSSPVAVAEIVRSGVVEGHHYGSIVALDKDGEVDWSVGMIDEPVFPRSCNKPIQALGMLRAGLDLPPDLLALACASHSGESFHVEGVRRILAGAGLDE